MDSKTRDALANHARFLEAASLEIRQLLALWEARERQPKETATSADIPTDDPEGSLAATASEKHRSSEEPREQPQNPPIATEDQILGEKLETIELFVLAIKRRAGLTKKPPFPEGIEPNPDNPLLLEVALEVADLVGYDPDLMNTYFARSDVTNEHDRLTSGLGTYLFHLAEGVPSRRAWESWPPVVRQFHDLESRFFKEEEYTHEDLET